MRALEEIHSAENPNQIPEKVFEALVEVVPATEQNVILDLLAPHVAIAHRNLEQVEKLRRMARQVIPQPTDLERVGLTPREAEVLHWVMQGKSDHLIASILEISVRTVNQHIGTILKKLQSGTRGSAGYEAMVKLKNLEAPPRTAGIAVAG